MFKKGQREGGNKTDEVETIIGPSVKIEGDFTSNGNIIISGFISGKLSTTQNLRIEAGAKITADVKAREAVIAGEVNGNIIVEGNLEILSTAKITGDIRTRSIAIQQGAQLNGSFVMAEAGHISVNHVLDRSQHGEKEGWTVEKQTVS